MPSIAGDAQHEENGEISEFIRGFGRFGYVADRALATAVYLLVRLPKPLLIEREMFDHFLAKVGYPRHLADKNTSENQQRWIAKYFQR